MDNYNLSFIGGVIGFIGVLAYKIYRYEQPKEKYIDIVVLSFLFAAVVGYLAAFVGGQIYGRPTLLPIGIIYGNESAIPYTSSILPLALFYSLGCFFLFSTLYILREIIRIPGYIGYIGIALYSCFLFIGEFFTGSDDLVRSLIFINASQI